MACAARSLLVRPDPLKSDILAAYKEVETFRATGRGEDPQLRLWKKFWHWAHNAERPLSERRLAAKVAYSMLANADLDARLRELCHQEASSPLIGESILQCLRGFPGEDSQPVEFLKRLVRENPLPRVKNEAKLQSGHLLANREAFDHALAVVNSVTRVDLDPAQQKQFDRLLHEIRNLRPGSEAPQVEGNGGKQIQDRVSGNPFKNARILLFWSEGCSISTRLLAELESDPPSDAIVTAIEIGLAGVEPSAPLEAFPRNVNSSFRYLQASGKFESLAARRFAVRATPTLFVINFDNRIVGKTFSSAGLSRLLARSSPKRQTSSTP